MKPVLLFALSMSLALGDEDRRSWREQVEADWLRQAELRFSQTRELQPAEDAAGAVDGVKSGKWGFHTGRQKDPWWQVDLGEVYNVSKIIVLNRGDAFAERAAYLQVWLSQDGKKFTRAYTHNGQQFGSGAGGDPLTIRLESSAARLIRLSIPGDTYLHLDEVEVFEAGRDENIALHKSANQSSLSEWSANHLAVRTCDYPVAEIVKRGLKLAENQRRLGADVNKAETVLRETERHFAALPATAVEGERRALYFKARWAIRDMALRNPLLDFDRILFVKRAPGMFPHMSDQYYGWWSRPGGGLFVLEDFKRGEPRTRCLTADLPPGSVQGPDLSFDAKRVLFAWSQFDPGVADEKNKSSKTGFPKAHSITCSR
jgi:hypothetical protein